MEKGNPLACMTPNPKLCLTRKELAGQIGRTRGYVADMIRGGFRLPATVTDAVDWIRANPPPSRNRKRRRK
jgi:hypothetical protein